MNGETQAIKFTCAYVIELNVSMINYATYIVLKDNLKLEISTVLSSGIKLYDTSRVLIKPSLILYLKISVWRTIHDLSLIHI